MSNYPDKVYLNGEIINASDAKISVFDRGFLFGDGVYEVMVQLNGNFFFGKEHLARLATSIEKVNIAFNISAINREITTLLTASNLKTSDCLLYIQITRGIAPRKHAFPKNSKPTLLMYAVPFSLPAINAKAITVVTSNDFRWHRCDIKMISLLGNVMANDFAIKNNHYETVFHRNGKMTEGSHSNLFFVKDGQVFTHPADQHILNGITREIVLKICRDNQISYQEKAISFSELSKMDEAFLTGTSTQIVAIRKLDNHVYFKEDKKESITQFLQQEFLKLKQHYSPDMGY